MIPLVKTEVINPTTDPIPERNDFFKEDLLNRISAMMAPTNGPIRIPMMGMTKGPMIKPIVLPQRPALEPPNFLTPKALAMASAPNSRMTNRLWIAQNHQADR